MNIYDAILRDMPQAAYAFTASATTYSSINASGVTMTSSPAAVLSNQSMVTGATKSVLMASGAELRVPFAGRFSSENSNRPFSLEAYVGIVATNAFTIAGHKNQGDGLLFDGDYIRFTAKFAGSITVSAAWAVPDLTKNYHVVGTYDRSRLSLYIDGALVSEAAIPEGSVLITQADKDIYTIATAPATFRIEAPAYYYFSLSAEQVAFHYSMARRIPVARDTVTRAGGALWTFSDAERDIQYSELVDWNAGLGDNVDQSGDQLKPNYEPSTGLSVAGTYTFSVPIANLDTPVTVYGMKVEWNGDGTAVVEYSINDGGAWTVLVNGAIPANTVGMAGTVTPLIRVTFASGRAVDLDIIRDMRVTTYSSPTLYSRTNSERTATIAGTTTTSMVWREPIEFDEASGTVLEGGTNAITISESTQTDFQSIAALEAWVTLDTITPSSYLFDSRGLSPANTSYMWINSAGQLAWTGIIVYVDGVQRPGATFVPVAGRTYHIVAVYTAPHNAKIKLTSVGPGNGNKISWLMMGTYPTAPTAAQALALYKSYSEMPTLTVSDTNAVVLAESTTQTKVYVNDWSIQGAG